MPGEVPSRATESNSPGTEMVRPLAHMRKRNSGREELNSQQAGAALLPHIMRAGAHSSACTPSPPACPVSTPGGKYKVKEGLEGRTVPPL